MNVQRRLRACAAALSVALAVGGCSSEKDPVGGVVVLDGVEATQWPSGAVLVLTLNEAQGDAADRIHDRLEVNLDGGDAPVEFELSASDVGSDDYFRLVSWVEYPPMDGNAIMTSDDVDVTPGEESSSAITIVMSPWSIPTIEAVPAP